MYTSAKLQATEYYQVSHSISQLKVRADTQYTGKFLWNVIEVSKPLR
jgi:hypothetical protein